MSSKKQATLITVHGKPSENYTIRGRIGLRILWLLQVVRYEDKQ